VHGRTHQAALLGSGSSSVFTLSGKQHGRQLLVPHQCVGLMTAALVLREPYATTC
jgi:hypothetical protein